MFYLLHICFQITSLILLSLKCHRHDWISTFLSLFSLLSVFLSYLLIDAYARLQKSTRAISHWLHVESLLPCFIFFCSNSIKAVEIKCYSWQCLIFLVLIAVNTSITIKTFGSALSILTNLLTHQGKLGETVLLRFFLYKSEFCQNAFLFFGIFIFKIYIYPGLLRIHLYFYLKF